MDYWIKICDLKMALNNGILKFNILFFQMKYSVNITVLSFYSFSPVLTCWVTLHPLWVKTDIHGASGPIACVHQKQNRALVHQADTGTHILHQLQWTENPGMDLPGMSSAVHSRVYPAPLLDTPWWTGCNTKQIKMTKSTSKDWKTVCSPSNYENILFKTYRINKVIQYKTEMSTPLCNIT